jgi:hypothetical protein
MKPSELNKQANESLTKDMKNLGLDFHPNTVFINAHSRVLIAIKEHCSPEKMFDLLSDITYLLESDSLMINSRGAYRNKGMMQNAEVLKNNWNKVQPILQKNVLSYLKKIRENRIK